MVRSSRRARGSQRFSSPFPRHVPNPNSPDPGHESLCDLPVPHGTSLGPSEPRKESPPEVPLVTADFARLESGAGKVDQPFDIEEGSSGPPLLAPFEVNRSTEPLNRWALLILPAAGRQPQFCTPSVGRLLRRSITPWVPEEDPPDTRLTRAFEGQPSNSPASARYPHLRNESIPEPASIDSRIAPLFMHRLIPVTAESGRLEKSRRKAQRNTTIRASPLSGEHLFLTPAPGVPS